MGHYIGLDAHEKLCHVVLGPTINMQRDPRAGRYFESYSEDPHLTGRLGHAWVAGAQASVPGMAATMKHFVGNEAETDRRFSSSNVSKQALREVYLDPFREIMAGLKREGAKAYGGQPACVMTAYNRVNGVSASENDETVNGILRTEWGFKGLVTSDWFSLHAPGLNVTDLEMPGPALHRKMPDLLDKVDIDDPAVQKAIDRCALQLLDLVHKTGRLGYSKSPEEEKEKSIDVNKVGPSIRRIAAEGSVLLKNTKDVLPIEPRKGLRIACIGSPWTDPVQSGGGSANLTPQKVLEPLATLKDAVGKDGVRISHHRGCDIHNFLPLLKTKMYIQYFSGRSPGSGNLIGEQEVDVAHMSTWHPRPNGLQPNDWWMRARLELPPCEKAGCHRFGLTALGRVSVKASQGTRPAQTTWHYEGEQNIFEYFLNPARIWGLYQLPMAQDERVAFTVDYVPIELDDTIKDTFAGGFQIGFEHEQDEDKIIEEAAQVANEADVAIVLTALGKDWESEGFDRPDMRLPRKQNQLVEAITKKQPATIVLNITGSPVEMPWREQVAGIVQVWYGGQEGAEALMDVLLARGDAPASGRLASTWPAQIEDHPSAHSEATFPGVPGEGGPHVTYNEGRLLGYRWFNTNVGAAKPAYFLGAGSGGYTAFKTELVRVSGDDTLRDHKAQLDVTVKTTNVGKRSGKEVAQLYLRYSALQHAVGSGGKDAGVEEPLQKLVGFAILRAQPGENAQSTVRLYQDAFSVWDEASSCWRVRDGDYDLALARSADVDDTLALHSVHISKGWTWTGLGV